MDLHKRTVICRAGLLSTGNVPRSAQNLQNKYSSTCSSSFTSFVFLKLPIAGRMLLADRFLPIALLNNHSFLLIADNSFGIIDVYLLEIIAQANARTVC